MNIEIRPSRPEDADSAVPHIYSSGPYSFDYVFATQTTTAVDFLRYGFSKRAGEFGYRDHVSVIKDGQIIGCGAVFAPQDSLSYTLNAVRQILGHYGPFFGIGVIRRGLAIERLVQPAKKDLWIIAHLGIDPEFQGQGIGYRLIEHLLASIRRRGGRRVGLDVALINPRAEELYNRIGFEITAERKSTLSNQYGVVPDFHRMELRL